MKAALAFAALLALMLILSVGELSPRTLILVLLGWVPFAVRTLPQVTFDGAGIASGLVVVVLVLAVIHGLGKVGRGAGWRLRWSLSTLAAIVLMFCSGLVVVGLLRSVGWLFQDGT